MGKDLPLAECAFGWGRVFRLYADYLDVNGVPYALSALTRIRPTFRTTMGIPSARLELWFGRKKVVLRGIASFDDARAVLEYLSAWCRQEISLASLEQPTLPGKAVRRRAGKLSGGSLPSIPVPVRLLPGEKAYYSSKAALCGEPIGEESRVTYPARDQGTLILTNRRMIYIGRKSQVVVDYAHLLRFSRLHGAIAVQTDYRSRREIFEIRKPEECAHYLETILARWEQESRPSALERVTGDEGLSPEQGTTGHLKERSAEEDEIETDGLNRRNWRMERMRMRLRDTEDFQERWQEQRAETRCLEAVEGGGCVKGVESVEDMSEMKPESVVDALSQEVGGSE
ncbi:MAG TPA: hypothetical protein VKV40_19605 [Ktedonobacteraceae bacterium]|nr:hypothetical protein [Ktedonobacteraceae bacterium]